MRTQTKVARLSKQLLFKDSRTEDIDGGDLEYPAPRAVNVGGSAWWRLVRDAKYIVAVVLILNSAAPPIIAK
jgi:hypothetical protein